MDEVAKFNAGLDEKVENNNPTLIETDEQDGNSLVGSGSVVESGRKVEYICFRIQNLSTNYMTDYI